MAQMQSVDTHIQINQPSKMTGRPVVDYAGPIAQGMGVLVEAFSPKKNEDDIARELLSELNTDLSSMKQMLVDQKLRPAEFRDQAQANLIEKLSRSKNLSPKTWSAIKSQYDARLDTLSKEHWFQSDGKQIVIGFDGSAQVMYSPDRTEEDQDLEALQMAFPKEWKSIANMIARNAENPTRERELIRRVTDLVARKTTSSLEMSILDDAKKTQGYTQAETQEQLQQNLYKTVGSQIQQALLTHLPSAVVDPDQAYADFLLDTQLVKSMLIEDAARAGMNMGQLEGVIDSQAGFMKGLFDARSQYAANSTQVKALEMEQELRLLKMIGELDDAEFVAVMKPNSLMSLMMNEVYGKMVSNSAARAFGITRQSQHNLEVLNNRVKNKEHDQILEDAIGYFDAFVDGRQPDLFTLQQYYEAVKRSPEALSPENRDKLKDLEDTFTYLMENNDPFRRAMTMKKTELPVKED